MLLAHIKYSIVNVPDPPVERRPGTETEAIQSRCQDGIHTSAVRLSGSLVEPGGLEPPTSALQRRRSPS